MTLEEAQAIGQIVGYADGGCSVCVDDLVNRLNERFPEFVWSANEDTQYDANQGSFLPVTVVRAEDFVALGEDQND